jgi:hypothetical protein
MHRILLPSLLFVLSRARASECAGRAVLVADASTPSDLNANSPRRPMRRLLRLGRSSECGVAREAAERERLFEYGLGRAVRMCVSQAAGILL